jgi:hypothetical protein
MQKQGTITRHRNPEQRGRLLTPTALEWHVVFEVAGANLAINRVNANRFYSEQHLASVWPWPRYFLQLESFRTALLMNLYCLHVFHVSLGLRFCGPHRRKHAKMVYGPVREGGSAFNQPPGDSAESSRVI